MQVKFCGIDAEQLCFSLNEEELAKTINTQPALFLTEMAITKALELEGISANNSAGLSLGEYSSMCFSGAISFENTLKLVQKRGIYMNNEILPGNYAMVAVIGLDSKVVEDICISEPGFITPSNYNCPGQVVISGEKEIVEIAEEKFKEAGCKRYIYLNVTSPFHTEKLINAKEKFEKDLENVFFNTPQKRVYKNIDGTPYSENSNIREILANHITSPVYFENCIQNMINDGINTFIEVGPGKTLSGFIKKTSKDVNTYQIENLEDITKLKQ